MMNLAETGYAQTRKVSSDPRQIEAQLLRRFATAMESARPDTPDGYRQLAEAVHQNSQLWSAVAVDLASQDNQLPEGLRAQLLALAQFSLAEGLKVLNGAADPASLIVINREVASGLSTQAAAIDAA